MDNNITLFLGGEERKLVFGKNKILRHLGDLTKDSGFNLLDPAIWRDPAKSYQAVYYFVYAGLLCANHNNLKEETVREWVDDLDLEKLDDIKFAGYSAITQKSVDQLKNLSAQVEKAIMSNGAEKVL